MKKIRVGIPKALLYYYYFPFWLKLFSELNLEVIISDNTSRELLDQGVKNSISEICVPIKLMVGHILNLEQKNVDYIFLPRFISIRKNLVLCPKFLGLTDLLRHSLPDLKAEIISDQIEAKTDDISSYSNHLSLRERLSIPKKELKKALTKAAEFWQRYRKLLYQGYMIASFSEIDNIKNLEKLIDKYENNKRVEKQNQKLASRESEEKIDIALISYVYNLYDNYINMDIINKLKKMGVQIHTFSMVSDKKIEKELSKLRKPFFWEFTNKLYGAAEYYLKNKEIDGVIHLTAFGCGPDSMLGSILELDAKKFNKAFMTLRIDEQTGASHIITRIEAFIDLLRLKKENN